MRSLTEVRFRLHQEAANFYLLWRKPTFHDPAFHRLNLPDGRVVADVLRRTPFAEKVVALAELVLTHRFPVLGTEIVTGPEIQWRRDYLHGKESGLAYFKRIPYLNFESVGDHKLVWEINRHQHLVLLAQAFLLTDRPEFVREIETQLQSWFTQNSFQRGINWASALEVAFRTLSWIWVYHLVGEHLEPAIRSSLVNSLYQHGRHLAENLSVYFSPNTHLLGEAVALFALATLFPQLPDSSEWAERSSRIVSEQLDFQVKGDGSHFEQSTYYHVYAVDFFLFFYILSGRTPQVRTVLLQMAEYLSWLLGVSGEISFFGDDDGGRLFHPYGQRSGFGRATLATCGVLFNRPDLIGTVEDLSEEAAWWLGPDCLSGAKTKFSGVIGSKLFKDSGSVFLQAGEFRLQMDCGPFGFGGAGHSHSDTLSFTLQASGEPVLVDPGTFTYISDIAERNWFRGSEAHNTVRVDHGDQAKSVNPFRWADKPSVTLSRFDETSEGWLVDAICDYEGIRHRRRVLLNDARLLVLDEISGVEGEHVCEQIWQLGPKASHFRLATSAPNEQSSSRFSPAYARKVEGQCVIAKVQGRLPILMAMLLCSDAKATISTDQAVTIFEKIS